MLYIFEMANNHMGSVAHAKRIIDEFAQLAAKYQLQAGIKLQFRQLESFIHPDFQDSDIKHIKRFRETRLSKEEFLEIVEYIRSKNLVTIATPFDNESVQWITDFDIEVVKIASSSIDDWPLLEEASHLDKRFVISTGGADMLQVQRVYNLFTQAHRNFALMHCVGIYPTPHTQANLQRISEFKQWFPEVEIGVSTHESPAEPSIVPLAVAMGCTIIEKHVGIRTSEFPLNEYSCEPQDMVPVIEAVQYVQAALTGEPEQQTERASLHSLKRGVYARHDLSIGTVLQTEDVYLAMPLQDNQYNASAVPSLLGTTLQQDLPKGKPLLKNGYIHISPEIELPEDIKQQIWGLLHKAQVTITPEDRVELSQHYGSKDFQTTGAVLITKFNRDYCKKLVILLPGQSHPGHWHQKKEEVFELISGDCELLLDGQSQLLNIGQPVVIAPQQNHALKTKSGCVIEEISTHYMPGDSFYDDVAINEQSPEERKLVINLFE